MVFIESGAAVLDAGELEAVRKLIADTTDEERAASGLSAIETELCGDIYGALTDARDAGHHAATASA